MATSMAQVATHKVVEHASPVVPNGTLGPHDWVGFTFMLATGIMLASTAFFWLERPYVPKKWQPSMTVAGLVTGVAFWNYCFMREAWLMTHESPLVYRYCDWLITVPLQILEFYFVLSAGDNGTGNTFWALLVSSIAMLVFGYIGEAGMGPAIPMWVCGCICWLFIVFYTFAGEAGKLVAKGSASQQAAFNSIRLIVSVGWLIYPIGYLCGFAGIAGALNWLNALYNVADLVNKTAFGLAIYSAAMMDATPNYA